MAIKTIVEKPKTMLTTPDLTIVLQKLTATMTNKMYIYKDKNERKELAIKNSSKII